MSLPLPPQLDFNFVPESQSNQVFQWGNQKRFLKRKEALCMVMSTAGIGVDASTCVSSSVTSYRKKVTIGDLRRRNTKLFISYMRFN